MKKYVILLLVFLFSLPLCAQELAFEVTANFEKLKANEKENLRDFVQHVRQYLNGHQWTKEDFNGEQIKCALNIFFEGTKGPDRYIARAFIGSQRPVYKSGKNTAMVRVMDDNWEFTYLPSQSLIHDDLRFDPLLSFLDFYAYLILGADFDSFKSGGGTQFYEKAMEIVNRGRGYGGAGKGWELSNQGAYTRGALIDEVLNAKYRDFRDAVYRYHYKGLDWLSQKPEKAKKNMLDALTSIAELKERLNQRSILMNFFFETKHPEIAETFLEQEDQELLLQLVRIDPQHSQTYEEFREKREKGLLQKK